MDKDYRSKIDEISELIHTEDRDAALAELDSFNWRKVHNINLLLRAAKIYEEVNRFDDARDLLEMAYERSPVGRLTIYELALLCIKMGDLDAAQEYYDDYVSLAPNEYRKYIIKYRLSAARGADDFTLIAILEELKDAEFLEDWAYELACLYHKTGQADKCVETADEIALYYGTGPYVKKALELKMLYQPLTKEQEKQYRQLIRKEKKTKVADTGEKAERSQEDEDAVDIGEIPVPAGKFDTINLQAEIKKNINEIMNATETGEVSENMAIIKNLVGDIPYVTMPDEEGKAGKSEEEKKSESKVSDDTLRMNYQKYLSEEYDGQISMKLPDDGNQDIQIDGQMTIQDVMDDWAKTKRAAEAALADAKQEKLNSAKAEALAEANHIMDRLENVIPKLDAGVQPQELLQEEYLSKPEEADTEITEPEELDEMSPVEKRTDKSFDDSIVEDTDSSEEEKTGEEPEVKEAEADFNTETEGDKVNFQDASRLMADVNDMLQKEIDRLNGSDDLKMDLDDEGLNRREESQRASDQPAEERNSENPEIAEEEPEEKDDQSLLADTYAELANQKDREDAPEEDIEIEEDPGDTSDLEEEEIRDQESEEEAGEEGDYESEPDAETALEDTPAENPETPGGSEEPDLSLTQSLTRALQDAAEQVQGKKNFEEEDPDFTKQDADDADTDIDRETETEGSLDATQELETDEIELQSPEAAETIRLTEEEKELFSYFTPIDGMEDAICRAAEGMASRLLSDHPVQGGCLVIIGGSGSGKTTLARGIISVLQGRYQVPGNNVGRIDADKLNDKDVQSLYHKIQGGCLVVEQAGQMNLETAVSLSLIMDSDPENTLVILEDDRKGIDRVLSLNGKFRQKFTEKIRIPVFTVDELVNFGKTYASDNGFVIDEMGVLALYDRINSIQRLDRPTYLVDVKEIMDEAIEKASKKSFFHRKKSTRDGMEVLVEKDFL